MDIENYFGDFTRRDWQQATDGSVRFAVIALGWFTRDVALPAMTETDLCTPTVMVSGSKEKATDVADSFDADHGITYEEFHDGVARDAYDAVYIVTPNALHLPFVETAAAFDKDVLCEKPMERNLERSRQLIEVCDEEDVRLMIAYRLHTEPAARRLKELLSDGYIGEPVQLYGVMTHDILGRWPDTDQWRLDEELAGGGAMMDIGLYPLNTTRYLLDEDPVAVQAIETGNRDGFEEVDETMTFQAQFEGDATLSGMVSHNAHQTSRLTVIGREGQITIEEPFFFGIDRSVTIEFDETSARLEFDQVHQMTEEFDYFADRILTGRDIYPDGRHGLVDMEAIHAVYDSVVSGQRIEL